MGQTDNLPHGCTWLWVDSTQSCSWFDIPAQHDRSEDWNDIRAENGGTTVTMLIDNVRLWDGTGQAPQPRMAVEVRDARIAWAGPAAAWPCMAMMPSMRSGGRRAGRSVRTAGRHQWRPGIIRVGSWTTLLERAKSWRPGAPRPGAPARSSPRPRSPRCSSRIAFRPD